MPSPGFTGTNETYRPCQIKLNKNYMIIKHIRTLSLDGSADISADDFNIYFSGVAYVLELNMPIRIHLLI